MTTKTKTNGKQESKRADAPSMVTIGTTYLPLDVWAARIQEMLPPGAVVTSGRISSGMLAISHKTKVGEVTK